MTIPAYNYIYLSKTARAVGNMLHNAVCEFGYDGDDFLRLFIQSDIAKQIEIGSPKYAVGKSGAELFAEVIERAFGRQTDGGVIETYDRSPAYWIGWALTHYQWHSGRSFRDIIETVPYRELSGLYGTLHEADINKVYEVLDEHFNRSDCKLKHIRKRCHLTQGELAERSGVSVNTVRAYERRAKDINKAQLETILNLAKALKCNVTDLLD